MKILLSLLVGITTLGAQIKPLVSTYLGEPTELLWQRRPVEAQSEMENRTRIWKDDLWQR